MSVVHLPTACCLRRLVGHSGAVNCVAWSRARQYVVSASDDRTLRVWRLRYSQQQAEGGAFGASNGQHVAGWNEVSDDEDDEGSAETESNSVSQHLHSGGRVEEGADRKRRRQRNAARGGAEAANGRSERQQQQSKASAGRRENDVQSSL